MRNLNFIAYILYIYINNRRKAKDNLITSTDILYDLLYQCLCRFDNRIYSAKNNLALSDYANLTTLLSCWLKGQDRRQNDGGLSTIAGEVLYIHPKLLPHYIHCVRYQSDHERVLGFLLELKIYVTEDTNLQMQSMENEDEDSDGEGSNRVSQCHRLLIHQCIMKELTLLHLRFQKDECGFCRQ